MNLTMDTLAEMIRVRREDRGWSHGELARRAGVGHGTIGNLEGLYSKVKAPNLATLTSVLGALGGRLVIEWTDTQETSP